MVAEDDEMSKDKEIHKLMALISLSLKKIYKPTNNNLRTTSNTSRAKQDNSPRINRGIGYDNQRLGHVVGARETVGTTVELEAHYMYMAQIQEVSPNAADSGPIFDSEPLQKEEAGIQLNAEQVDWRDDTNDESKDQELEAHYMYMAQIQEVSLDAADFGPIFDAELVQKVSNNDNYNVFTIESEHPEQSESIHNTYSIEQVEHNVIIDSLDISYDREQIDQNDDDNDLANEHELLASLIEKLKYFKNQNKSLESSNNRFKEANNKLSETNALMYQDLEKFQAELDKRNDVKSVGTIFDGVERCKETISKRTYFRHIDPFIQNTIEANFSPEIRRINADLEKFHVCLNEEMVADLRYFNSLELEVDSLRSQLETQKTQFLNEIDRLLREYYYADHMNAILSVYTNLDEILPLNKKSILKNTNVLASRMYKLHTEPTQTRTSQLPNYSRKTNKRVSFSTGAIPTTSVSRTQLKSNPIEDRVKLNNSQGKKQEVENHHRNVKFSKNKTFVTVCNDSLNAKNSNVNFVYATCGKCVLNEKHDMCVLKSINGVNSKTKMPIDVPLIEIVLFIIDFGCSKHMTGNLKLLINFVEKFLDLEVAFWKSTCFIRDLKGNDLLTGTEFLNKTFHAYFASEGILHQTSVARTPEQNGVVERPNRTLVEAARTMLSTAKEIQIKMIQVKEMMQDKDLKNSKLKDEGSRLRSQSMNDQSHYNQAKAKTKINKATSYKNVIGQMMDRTFSDNDYEIRYHPAYSKDNKLLEELADELALITFPPKYDDDLRFDVESDLKEIEFLLHRDKDSSLKDSIDQSNLANPSDNFVDSMPEMFTDEHALDYSFPPIFDEYDDDFLEVESDTKNVYDDPFDSRGEKIKESKLLIDELDLL
nr:putative RNA-directed DNA polymerase [Tanacetum cinerariifolium]